MMQARTKRAKTVFIAHPIAGDIKGNTIRVLTICEQIHSKKIIPVAPYLVSLQYLNDDVIEDRELGILANIECFYRRYIDELWLFGNRISTGMKEEVILAFKIGIKVVAQTKETKRALRKLRRTPEIKELIRYQRQKWGRINHGIVS